LKPQTLSKAWREPASVSVPDALRDAIGGHPLVAELLVRRGYGDLEAARAFLNPERYRPASPYALPDLERAVERIERALRAGERICVWGDFDVDGQTATTLLVSALRDLGAEVTFHVPHRRRESHGVKVAALEEELARGAQLVLTCDTGVTAHEAVAYARDRGVDVVITDHHDLPPRLPAARAVVNPKRLSEAHPLRELPGVGVAYKLAEALYERAGWEEAVRRHLDLVALGIVADVAVQTGDTRYLLQRGLEALRATERVGLRALMEGAQVDLAWLSTEDIGFGLAPRLNALGRLSDASLAVELLTTEDEVRARVLAARLEGLNAERKRLCDQVAEAAEAQLAQNPALLDDPVLVLSHPTWPAGVIGIVAARLTERYHRPTILLSTPPGEPGRGSARSIEGCDIGAAIAEQAHLLGGFGGHPMAAGLSIEPARIPAFRRDICRTVREWYGEELPVPRLHIDGYLALGDLSLDLVRDLERLAPFGPGNPAPVLVSRGLSVASTRPVGRAEKHLQLVVTGTEGASERVIWWRWNGAPIPEGPFDLAYTLGVNTYQGRRELQLEWVDGRVYPEPATSVEPAERERAVTDYRHEPNPHRLLAHLRRGEEDVVVWGEATQREEVGGRDRVHLTPAGALVIWTAPPDRATLEAALETVDPERVYLFGLDPQIETPEQFLRRLLGLVKHAQRANQGRMDVATLAAATAQREEAVRVGLDWLAARGVVGLVEGADGLRVAASGEGASSEGSSGDLEALQAALGALLEETRAYRSYFSRAPVEALL
jgi:single-stranded-DNA-specific exonuclease